MDVYLTPKRKMINIGFRNEIERILTAVEGVFQVLL